MLTPRSLALLLFLASAAVIGAAWGFQLIGGLSPCELCLYERWPYYAVLVLTLAALLAGRQDATRAALALSALIFLAGTALALYHVGVEQHWIAGPTACTSGGGPADSIEALRRRLLAQQVVQCDEVQWSLLGISLAGWNAVASLVLTLASLAAFRRAWRRA